MYVNTSSLSFCTIFQPTIKNKDFAMFSFSDNAGEFALWYRAVTFIDSGISIADTGHFIAMSGNGSGGQIISALDQKEFVIPVRIYGK